MQAQVVAEVDVVAVGRAPGDHDVEVTGRAPVLGCLEGLAPGNPQVPPVRIAQAAERPNGRSDVAGRG